MIAINSDVATMDGVNAVVAAVSKEFSGADILVNNAGTGSNETIMDAPDEKWQYYWDLHVMAAMRLARGLVPSMKERGGGVILNNASICAAQPLWYEPIYNVTKAALVMLSKTMANEFIKDGIRVNAINPGFVLTPDWIKTAKQLTADTGGDWQGYIDGLAKENAPIARFASPEEIADFFVFLCSSRASYAVGSNDRRGPGPGPVGTNGRATRGVEGERSVGDRAERARDDQVEGRGGDPVQVRDGAVVIARRSSRPARR